MGSVETDLRRLPEKPLSPNQVLIIEDHEVERMIFFEIFQKFPNLELLIPQINSSRDIQDLSSYLLNEAAVLPSIVLVDQIKCPATMDLAEVSYDLPTLITMLKIINPRVWVVEYSFGDYRRKISNNSDSSLSIDELFESLEKFGNLSSHTMETLRDLTNDAFIRSQSYQEGVRSWHFELEELKNEPLTEKALSVAGTDFLTLEQAIKEADLELLGKILHDIWKIIGILKANKPLKSCAVTCFHLQSLLPHSSSNS